MPDIILESSSLSVIASQFQRFVLPEEATLDVQDSGAFYVSNRKEISTKGEVFFAIHGSIEASVAITSGTSSDFVTYETAQIETSKVGFSFGSFNTLSHAGHLQSDDVGIQAAFSNEIQNAGFISAANIGIKLDRGANQVSNFNKIEVNAVSPDGIAILSNGEANLVLNSGFIGARNAVVFSPDQFSGPIDKFSLINTGEIIADFHHVGRDSGLGTAVLQSLGELDRPLPVELVLENSGTIRGGTAAISTDHGVDRITNSGIIDGLVYLGLGNDEYRTVGNGQTDGRVYGMGGQDTLIGGRHSDDFDGGSNHDALYGNGGSDMLQGRAGDDLLSGGTGDDILIGDGGTDRLVGGAGFDILHGGEGDDFILGGAGRDIQFGGTGQDHFGFHAIEESTVGTTRDAIRDFEVGSDLIYLKQLTFNPIGPNQDLIYLGTSAFTGSGPELRHATTAAGSSVVQIDLDGDRVRDMEILVQFTPTLVESDFLL